MSFQDGSIRCCDCGTTFTFGAEEQEFLASKGFTNEPKRYPHAGDQGIQSVMEMIARATVSDAKCSPQHALSVAKRPKYRLSPAKVGQYILAITTIRSDSAGNASLTLRTYIGWGHMAYVALRQ